MTQPCPDSWSNSKMKNRFTWTILIVLTVLLAGCGETKPRGTAVYMLLDTSGTYTEEIAKAQKIIQYLLGTLTTGDSLAVAKIDSGSFSEKDIVAKVTFDSKPSTANSQKRTFQSKINQFVKRVKSSAYTDITGGMVQGIEFLNETKAGKKYILVFSDLKEEIKKGHIRDFPIDFTGIKVSAINVTKLRTDNVDPREYKGRLDYWQNRVESGSGQWRIINDLDKIDRLLGEKEEA